MANDPNRVEQEGLWRRAFQVLSSVELGRATEWTGPKDFGALRARVETLAILLDAMPRSHIAQLSAVLERWLTGVDSAAIPTRDTLRIAARLVLESDGHDPPSERERHRLKVRAVLGLPPSSDAEFSAITPSSQQADVDAQIQCVDALTRWSDQIETHPRWKFLSTGVVGDAPVPIDRVYVELLAVADDDVTTVGSEVYGGPARASRRVLASRYAAVGVGTMLTGTLERCIVVGEPGSGKSTLVHWLTRAVNQRRHPDFDLALTVRLSAFAQALNRRPDIDLVEFFFESLESMPADWRPAAEWLRRRGDAGRRLLLLDGWDEVPAKHRDAVRQAIRREELFFVTLITSRPSGLPRQFCEDTRVGFYHMAGLTPRAAEELVANLLAVQGRPDLLPDIMARIAEESDLQEMSANPFLLGLVVRVLVQTIGTGTHSHSVADLYHQVTNWIQEHHNAHCGALLRLEPLHFAAIRRLCNYLHFEASQPRYLFSQQEILERIDSHSLEPILQSRFINRTDMAFGEYCFLHATFQEYFTAVHVAGLDESELDNRIEKAFSSASRLRVLEFLAGLDGRAREHCVQQCEARLRAPDRFGQAFIRIARLATAGGWSTVPQADGLLRRLKSELWDLIVGTSDIRLLQPAVEALAQLDQHELIRRALDRRSSESLLRLIVNSVPEHALRTSGLLELLPGEWGEYERYRRKEESSELDFEHHGSTLNDRSQSADVRRSAIFRAAAARDYQLVSSLVAIVNHDDDDASVREDARLCRSLSRVHSERRLFPSWQLRL